MKDVIIIAVTDLPDCKFTSGPASPPRKSQALTLPNLEHVLERMGLRMRFNMMDKRSCFHDTAGPIPEVLQAETFAEVQSMLFRLDINSQGPLDALLEVIATRDRFHPMEDWMKTLKWDGVDHIGALVDSVTVSEGSAELWPIALETWLAQVVEGVCGWRGPERSLPYCLVLQGAQGIGKSNWFKRLGGEYMKIDGDIDLSGHNAEESQRNALAYPMIELSELDGITRKQDVAALKSFLSRPVDQLRKKYGRSDPPRIPRMTSPCATANVSALMNDPTGSRRYLMIAVVSFDWDAVIDREGIWAQARAQWLEHGFKVLDQEEAAIQKRAAVAFYHAPAEAELLASHLEDYGEYWDSYFALNCSMICKVLGLGTSRGTTATMREALTEQLGQVRGKIALKNNCWPFPVPVGMRHGAGFSQPMSETYAKKLTKWKTK